MKENENDNDKYTEMEVVNDNKGTIEESRVMFTLAALNPVATRSIASVENDAVRSIKEEMVKTKYSTAVKLLMQEGQKDIQFYQIKLQRLMERLSMGLILREAIQPIHL